MPHRAPESDWQRLSRLLDELFELEPGARQQRLEAIRREDAGLAERLAQLLAADEAAGILDGDLAAASPTAAARLAGEAAGTGRLQAGARLGHYRLVERIGAGGMGEVWRGERVDDFEQDVAIKLIRPLVDGPQLRERFARERRILARLDHPDIARLLDGGVSTDGTPWFAMEFVRGQDIVAFADARRLGARQRALLVVQVCDAVARAQAQLVVHRDLKPSNLLVDEGGRVRVLDFGIARLLDDSADARLTATGVRVYSPAYAAPEQIRGEPVGTAADVYALGAVLFELLTGQPPHPGRSGSPERLLAGLERETAPRPGPALRARSRDGAAPATVELAREVDDDLDQVVATALHPDPARRYAGAAQLAADLRRWLEGHPIAARADSTGYRVRRFVSRHRLGVASAAAVLLALVGGLGLALWHMGVAREQARRADAQAQRVERTYRFVMSLFRNIQPTRGGGRDQQQSVEILLRDGLARMDEELADLPDVRAGLRASWSELLVELGHLEEGRAHLERAVAEYEALSPQADDDLASALINVAGAYKESARLAEAEAAARRALALLEALPGDQRPRRIQARTVLANIATTSFRTDEAIALHEQILADRLELPGIRPGDLAVNYNNLATAYLYADRFVEAERRYRELDRLLLEDPATPPSRRAYSLSGIAWSLLGQGRSREAEAIIDQMQALARETLSPNHDLVVNGQVLRARAAMAEGRFDQADQLFTEAIPRLAPSTAAIALLRWGEGLALRGRFDEALPRLREAGAALEASGRGESPPGLLAAALVAATEAAADPAAAGGTARVEAAVARFEALGQQHSEDYLGAVLALSDLHAARGQRAQAQAVRARAADIAAGLLGEDHPLTRRARAAPPG